ncbi:MAG: hypothetical protein M5R41_05245 [Bacteroidia bacterium]|nr:hypothetical protein [Bacteroidia bacterium]
MLNNTLIVYRHSPEPASDTATVAYELRKSANVSLKLYNNLGTIMTERKLGAYPKGRHTVVLEVAAYPEGMYYYLIEADGAAAIRSITVSRSVHDADAAEVSDVDDGEAGDAQTPA